MPLLPDVLYVLAHQLEIDSTKKTVRIAAFLDPDLYDRVTTVFGGLGARWVGKAAKGGRHKFPSDPKPLIDLILLTGEDNPGDFFSTPDVLADYMAQCLDIEHLPKWATILDPDYGFGSLTKAVRRAAAPLKRIDLSYHGVEINAGLATLASADAKGRNKVFHADYLIWPAPQRYDAAILNSPFGMRSTVNVAGDPNIYIRHILKTWFQLKPGGLMVALAPPGWTFRNERAKDWQMPFLDEDTVLSPAQFRTFVESYGRSVTTRQGLFKDSGTEIAVTVILLGTQKGSPPAMPELPDHLAPPKPKEAPQGEDRSLEDLLADMREHDQELLVAQAKLYHVLADLFVPKLTEEASNCVRCGISVRDDDLVIDATFRRWHTHCSHLALSTIPHIYATINAVQEVAA